MRRNFLLCPVFLFLFLCLPIAVTAQATCPANVLLALARTASTCARTGRNQACYGNGAVTATAQPNTTITFNQPGALGDLAAMQSINTQAGEDLGTAILQIQANLADTEQRTVTMLLYGNTTVENLVPPAPEMSLTATGQLNIRARPTQESAILDRVGVYGTVIATGRTSDNTWLRVVSPQSSVSGWVSASAVSYQGNIYTLSVVQPSAPFYRPFQVVRLHTGMDDPPCDGAPPSGALIQAPNVSTPVELILNGVTMRLSATMFVQASADSMTVSVIDGETELAAHDSTTWIPAGARAQVALNEDGIAAAAPSPAEPLIGEDIANVPVNILAFRVRIPEPLTAEEIETRTAARATPEPLVVQPDELQIDECRRVTRRRDTLWAGPGLHYEAINEIAAGRRVYPVVQVTDRSGIVWLQLNNSNWIRAAAVETSGNCDDIPVTQFVQPPNVNLLTLETCETNNGPLRAGQYVTIRFVPPSWETYEEARQATRVDPGTITINGVRHPVYASPPQQLSLTSWIRTFTTHWVAVSGSHRIEGERNHYNPICNLTVPVG